MESKRVLVLGASTNNDRYSNMACKLLRKFDHDVIAVGNREGEIGDVLIQTSTVGINKIDTVTLYLGVSNQTPYYDFILNLKPKRVIFNPGTENFEFMEMLEKSGVETIEDCTLIMLNSNNF